MTPSRLQTICRGGLRRFWRAREGSVAIEGAFAFGVLAAAFLGLFIFGGLTTQVRQSSSATYVLGDLVSSHIGALTCDVLDGYFDNAHVAYRVSGLGTDSALTDEGSREYRMHVVGVQVELEGEGEDERLVPRVRWRAYRDVAPMFEVGDETELEGALAYEGAFYVQARGRVILRDPTDLFLQADSASDVVFTFAPRYESVLVVPQDDQERCQTDADDV